MDKSYIDIGKLGEYFGSTVVKAKFVDPDNPPLIYIKSFDFMEPEEEGVSRVGVGYSYEGGSAAQILDMKHYDEWFHYIDPWFPESFWVEDKDNNKSAFFSVKNCNHYKRSACGERYRSMIIGYRNREVMPIGHGASLCKLNAWSFVERDIETAIEISLELNGLAVAINQDLALMNLPNGPGKGSVLLLYKDISIGVIDNNLNIKLHPKYENHFSHYTQKLQEVA